MLILTLQPPVLQYPLQQRQGLEDSEKLLLLLSGFDAAMLGCCSMNTKSTLHKAPVATKTCCNL